MTHTMEGLYEKDRIFHNKLKVLKNKTGVLEKTSFNNMNALKIRINGHDKDLDILDRNVKYFLPVTTFEDFLSALIHYQIQD